MGGGMDGGVDDGTRNDADDGMDGGTGNGAEDGTDDGAGDRTNCGGWLDTSVKDIGAGGGVTDSVGWFGASVEDGGAGDGDTDGGSRVLRFTAHMDSKLTNIDMQFYMDIDKPLTNICKNLEF